jgi:predicted dehydrogenase
MGLISFAHIHALSYADCLKRNPDVEFVAFFDDDGKRADEMSRKYGVPACGTLEALFAKKIDAVVVASPNAEHLKHVKAAADANVHVLCEKPIAVSLAEAREAIRYCEKKKVKLQAAFPCRYFPGARSIKELVDEGRIGKVIAASCSNRGKNPGGWFVDKAVAGGGAVIDHTVHVVDLLRWILDDEVKNVYAETGTFFSRLDVEDGGLLFMEFKSGIFASLDTSWSHPTKAYPIWGDLNIRLIGTAGTIDFVGFNQKMEIYRNESDASEWNYFGEDIDYWMIDDFASAVEKDTPVWTTGRDGAKALEVALAAYKSTKNHRVVSLPRKRGI